MSVVPSDLTKQQSDLYGVFLEALAKVKSDVMAMAGAYKACVDAGIDMSRFGRALGFRLMKLAEGRLIPEANDKLLGNDAMCRVMVGLPIETQQRLLASGVDVWRDGAAVTVQIEDVMPREARRLIDPASGRLLDPVEQSVRAAPSPPKHDQKVTIALTREQYAELQEAASKARMAPTSLILSELVKAGVIERRRRNSA